VAPSGDVERQASRMAGTLWIDDASQQVIRIESHFIDDYLRRSLAFGALVQPLITVQFNDYRKFNVATDTAVTLPDAGR
jgi:hypothetical protein